MIIICGKTIAEVERDLEMAKAAIATGAPMGVGGTTIEDVEQALRGLRSALGENNPPISNPNYDPRWSCPECGAEYPVYDGECCDDCGYGYEDEEEDSDEEDQYVEDLIASAERLGIPMNAIHAWIDAWLK